MTATFADFCATADARHQIADNVLEWTQMLCEALVLDFKMDSIRRANFFNNTDPEYKQSVLSLSSVVIACTSSIMRLVASITR